MEITMEHKIQRVRARAADGSEKVLALVRISGQTAYVCPAAQYNEAVDNPALAVGFPMEDVTLLKGDAAN
jgi:hypothetical protein